MNLLTWFDGFFKSLREPKQNTKTTKTVNLKFFYRINAIEIDGIDKEFCDAFNQSTLEAIKDMKKGIKPKLVKIA